MTQLRQKLLATVAGQLGRPHGFTLRSVTEIVAALEKSGLTVEHHRLEDKPMPPYTIIGRRA